MAGRSIPQAAAVDGGGWLSVRLRPAGDRVDRARARGRCGAGARRSASCRMNLCDSGLAGCYTGRSVGEAAAVIRAVTPDLVTVNEVCRDDLTTLQQALANGASAATSPRLSCVPAGARPADRWRVPMPQRPAVRDRPHRPAAARLPGSAVDQRGLPDPGQRRPGGARLAVPG